MKLQRTFLIGALLATGLTSAPALADGPRGRDRPVEQNRPVGQNSPRHEQEQAFEAKRDGRSMPLPQLERRVMPFMGGADYLGPELNGGTYRLKFIQNGRMIWVDVDAQTGRIIRRSRP
jgi:hypothetical protein